MSSSAHDTVCRQRTLEPLEPPLGATRDTACSGRPALAWRPAMGDQEALSDRFAARLEPFPPGLTIGASGIGHESRASPTHDSCHREAHKKNAVGDPPMPRPRHALDSAFDDYDDSRCMIAGASPGRSHTASLPRGSDAATRWFR